MSANEALDAQILAAGDELEELVVARKLGGNVEDVVFVGVHAR